MQPDDPSAADPARNRVTKRRSLLGRISLPTLSSKKSLLKKDGRNETIGEEQRVIYDEPESYGGSGLMSPSAIAQLPAPEVLYEIPEVELDDDLAYANVELEEDYDKDVYRWAILYENQRGYGSFTFPSYTTSPYFLEQQFSRHPIILRYLFYPWILLLSQFPRTRPLLDEINQLFPSPHIPCLMVPGDGYPEPGWSICVEMGKLNMTDLSTTGSSVARNGDPRSAILTQVVGFVEGGGCVS